MSWWGTFLEIDDLNNCCCPLRHAMYRYPQVTAVKNDCHSSVRRMETARVHWGFLCFAENGDISTFVISILSRNPHTFTTVSKFKPKAKTGRRSSKSHINSYGWFYECRSAHGRECLVNDPWHTVVIIYFVLEPVSRLKYTEDTEGQEKRKAYDN